MLPAAHSVLKQFPFSEQRPGVTYIAVQPVSWNEPSILERRFAPGITPEEAIVIAADLIHDDYADVFEAYWDLWTPDESGNEWHLLPSLVRIIAQGEEFDDGTYNETGHIEIDFGLDALFVPENIGLTEENQAKIRDNVSKLVEFGKKLETEHSRHIAAPVVGLRGEPSPKVDRPPAKSAVKLSLSQIATSPRKSVIHIQ